MLYGSGVFTNFALTGRDRLPHNLNEPADARSCIIMAGQGLSRVPDPKGGAQTLRADSVQGRL